MLLIFPENLLIHRVKELEKENKRLKKEIEKWKTKKY